MGPDDILNGIHISFFILFLRTGFPRIGGTSPHVAFRLDLSTATFLRGGYPRERLRETAALQVNDGYKSFDRDLEGARSLGAAEPGRANQYVSFRRKLTRRS